MSQTFYVSVDHPAADDRAVGTAESPVASINEALRRAKPGDLVLVTPGVYREEVCFPVSGEPGRPITLRSAVPRGAIVRGSEVVASQAPAGFSQVALPSTMVATRNPFRIPLDGSRIGGTCGQVFVGDRMLREAGDAETVRACPDTWRAVDGGAAIEIHVDPSGAPGALEVSLRDRLLAPAERGFGHFRIEGFVFERCANNTAAAFWEEGRRQCGAIGFRAGHHIEFVGNEVRDVKSIGMDVGDEGGRDKTTDHIPHDNRIEGNFIHDCGEVAVCGRHSLRTVVRGNRIERNALLSLHTVEEAGLKFHQFYDGLIEGNLIRDNEAAGIWLDAMWDGARVTRNLVINNVGSGIFIELGSDQCTVDHNIVGYTRLGDGIYAHDASDVLIAHNLVFGNAHFGIYMRYVTDRPFTHRDGGWRPAQCSRNRILNNLFLDNYRGHLCLPAEGPRSGHNVSDHNCFLNGTQWQWEGAGFHRFCLGDNDGDIPAEEMLLQVAAAGVAPDHWKIVPNVSLEQWRALGYDRHSHAPSAFRITHENGAVVKGTATLGGKDAFLELRLSEEAAPPPVPSLPDFPNDYFGRPRGEATPAGPFAALGPGHHRVDVTPRIETNP